MGFSLFNVLFIIFSIIGSVMNLVNLYLYILYFILNFKYDTKKPIWLSNGLKGLLICTNF